MKKNKAQSILEYAIIIGVVSAALFAMQVYFRRGIQAVIKVAADEVGDQAKGAVEYDYKNEWVRRGPSNINTQAERSMKISQKAGGEISYDSNEAITKAGVLSDDIIKDED